MVLVIRFRLQKELERGHRVVVSGSIPELGNWDVRHAAHLRSQGHVHELYVTLVEPTKFDFKYVVVCEASEFAEGESVSHHWELGRNRAFSFEDVNSVGEAVELNHVWQSEESAGLPLIEVDPYLKPYAGAIAARFSRFRDLKNRIEQDGGGSLKEFAKGYEKFGLVRVNGGLRYQEWAPGASALSLVGDFNFWNHEANPCERDGFGVWSCFLADNADGTPAIRHRCPYKASVVLPSGERVDRIPAWATYVVQNPETAAFHAERWAPLSEQDQHSAAGGSGEEERAHVWSHPRQGWAANEGVKIYEAHVGMSGEAHRIASYREFADNVLPRIKELGYTAVQLMAVQEHAYYASFGYHVTNFFAPSSRCGTPEDLKYLVDTAHGLGLRVIMDMVHSHASKNVRDGLNNFDGSGHHYFHEGGRGDHAQWDSKCFNYSHFEVLRFLLSNLRWWLHTYRFDGYRFDGVTSMLYKHHGLGVGFSGGYHEYFNESVDEEAVAYLQLGNALLHSVTPPALTVAEDVSGMPGLCRPVAEGGVGFDMRLGMAVPDHWIKLLKEKSDDEWEMGAIVWALTNRRHTERTIAYCESHDQALVGDKTLAFRLIDSEMYDGMSTLTPASPTVDRGIALHKLIRLITHALGGEGYLNFMGNEFGHPEWIDFPREGNGNSFQYCRRQWSLVDNESLRYQGLHNFDVAMNALENEFHWLSPHADTYVSLQHENDKLIVFEKNGLLFVFNFNPTQSFADYRVGVAVPGKYVVALCSDDLSFGGQGRVHHTAEHLTQPMPHHNRPHSVQVYTPSRCVVVYRKVNEEEGGGK